MYSTVYTVTINRPDYVDVPPMVAYGHKDLRELREELRASGIKANQIKVTVSTGA